MQTNMSVSPAFQGKATVSNMSRGFLGLCEFKPRRPIMSLTTTPEQDNHLIDFYNNSANVATDTVKDAIKKIFGEDIFRLLQLNTKFGECEYGARVNVDKPSEFQEFHFSFHNRRNRKSQNGIHFDIKF